MVKTVVSLELPVDEVLEIKKNRLVPQGELTGKEKRISIVTGVHGDELEGQYVCFEVNRIIKENINQLTGIVDIYPALNPLGIDSITRSIPAFDMDMNRLFPGALDGNMTETMAAQIIEDIKGSDACVDIHASNIYLTEIPQIRINEQSKDTLVPLAKELNIDLIWIHGAATVLEATLAHSLNSRGVPTLVVEMGVGMRITKDYCDQLVDGIFHLMAKLGIWQGEVKTPRTPIISDRPEDVTYFNATCAGLFVPTAKHLKMLKAGDEIGRILDPLQGEVLDRILAPVDGMLFTIREYPIADEGSLLGRLLCADAIKKDA